MHPYLEELYSRNKQDEREKKNEESPYSPEAMGINENSEKPRSLNPLSPYTDQLEEARKLDTASQEESQLAGEAEKLQATPEDASASMWAGLADIGTQTASNYAKASGVQTSGKPFNEATETVKQKLTLKENLRKNLLDKVQAKKAEREAKKKSLYEQIGMGMKIAGEGREIAQEGRVSSDYAAKQARQSPGTPEAQARADFYKKAYKIDLDPSALSADDMDKLAPGMVKGDLDVSVQEVIEDGKLVKKVVAVDRRTGKVVRTTGIGEGAQKLMKGQEPALSEEVNSINSLTQDAGLDPVKYPPLPEGASREAVDARRRILTAYQASSAKPAELEKLQQGEETLRLFDKIAAMKSEVDTGPLAAGRHAVASWAGMADPKVAAFRRDVLSQVNSYIKQITGAQVTEGEADRLMATMPTMEDQDDVFMAKLQAARDQVSRYQSRYKDQLRKVGRGVGYTSGADRASAQPGKTRKSIGSAADLP
jgi:hypothetical protein